MECPKCGGGAYLSEEDLIQILEGKENVKLMLKATFMCRACSERFTRIVYDDMAARKKDTSALSSSQQVPSPYSLSRQPVQRTASRYDDEESEPAEGLKFF